MHERNMAVSGGVIMKTPGNFRWRDCRRQRTVVAWVGRHVLAEATEIPAHRLPGWQLLVVERGAVHCTDDGRPVVVRGGQAWLSPPGARLEGRLPVVRGRLWWIGFAPTQGVSAAVGTAVLRLLRARARRIMSVPAHWLQTCRDVDAAAEAQHRLGLLAAGLTLLAALDGDDAVEANDSAIAVALAAMTADPQRDWSVVALARTAGLAPSRFHERFRAVVGQSPHDLLLDQRCAGVADALRTDHATVAAIAARWGFASAQHCARAFRRRYGCTPAAWRARSSGG